WTVVGSMHDHRDANLTATRLTDGRVLVAGGGVGCGSYLATAEIYDPSTKTWAYVHSMSGTRSAHAAALIPGGATGKVLVASGNAGGTGEVYDPGTNTWTATGAMVQQVFYTTATTLPDGRVLFAGGSPS